MSAIVRLECALEPALQRRDGVQILMAIDQVKELSEALSGLAKRLERSLAGEKPTGAK
jgi:hypothetical protein